MTTLAQWVREVHHTVHPPDINTKHLYFKTTRILPIPDITERLLLYSKKTFTPKPISDMPMYTTCPRYSSRQPTAAPKEPNTPTPDLALAQLMSLLDPIINATSASQVPRQTHRTPRTVFTPKFDVQETATEYVLEGELPGLSDKSKLDIQFTDHKTLVVRGILEKVAVPRPEETTISTPKEVATPTDETTAPASPRPRSLKPTVEDTLDESDAASTTTSDEFEVILTPLSEKLRGGPPVLGSEKKPIVVEKETPAVKKPRTWVSERTFGPFQRSFSFPGLIDIENVSAGLEAGLLRIVVPKKTQSSNRKIVIA